MYGPRQDPNGEAGVVAIFAGRLLAGEPCTIFGDGEQTRDFVYVDDVVDAFVRAADGGVGDAVQHRHRRRDLGQRALRVDGGGRRRRPRRPTHAPARPGELARSALDPALAGEVLGWKPATSLDAGTAAVLDWFRAALTRPRPTLTDRLP